MPLPDNRSDFLVIGGGIVGLATAWRLLQRYPDLSVRVVEAEHSVGHHQSGNNSGVLHSGIYYKPGSAKAITCRLGKAAMEAFCSEQDIPWDRCGKVVVATGESELEGLDKIAARAQENGVEFERIHTDVLRELEPNAAGIAALHVPETGIVHFGSVCQRLAELIGQGRGEVATGQRVIKIDPKTESIAVSTTSGEQFQSGKLINCGGLQCDRVAQLAGVAPDVRIVPFRGEYYELAANSSQLVRNLIYPVPDPSFPFLGVHFTRMIQGGVECGPNAVLALSREGYDWKSVRLADITQTLSWPGFRKLARRHWRTGMGEMHRSLRKAAFVTALQRLMPCLQADDLVPGRAGVRAQAISRDGNLVDDFLLAAGESSIHVLNAPSPAATASLAIADTVIDRLEAIS